MRSRDSGRHGVLEQVIDQLGSKLRPADDRPAAIAQQFSRARVIADGTMLPGPTVPGTGGVLASPARMRVAHYLKGSGQRMIWVTTGITARGGARSATDYGIQPHIGERWQIEATSRAQPYVTSDCAGQTDRATRTTPLIWLAQLSALLADDPTTSAARAAAITAITSFSGVQKLGTMTDPQGRTGVAVAETATGLRPLTIATGPGCQNPIQGGAGCVGAASPRGSFRTTLIYDPTTDRPLSLQTALTADMPAAHLKAGTVLYQVSYLGGSIDPHPNIPSPAPPANRTVQSVPWQLASATGHTITVRWQSGTCDSQLPPNPEVNARETPQSITVSVYIHVVKGGFGFCAGVGLGGTNSTTLRDPIAGRKILHGTVTDHAR